MGMLFYVAGSALADTTSDGGGGIRAASIPAHRALGSASFLISIAAVLTGIMEKVTTIHEYAYIYIYRICALSLLSPVK